MPSPLNRKLPFIINYTKMTTPEIWQYYLALMDRYIILKDQQGQKLLKVIADMTMDEFFARVEKSVTIPEDEHDKKVKK